MSASAIGVTQGDGSNTAIRGISAKSAEAAPAIASTSNAAGIRGRNRTDRNSTAKLPSPTASVSA